MAINYSLINGIKYLSGTTSLRPANPVAGSTYFNTTIGALQVYQNGAWYTLQSILGPLSPTSVTATDSGSGRAYNNGQASVAFSPVTETGGVATSFTVTSSPGSYTATGTSSPILVTGLQSSTAYTYTVTASNLTSTSNSSSASSAVTATTVPQAPSISAVGASQSAVITITPGATGGSVITQYSITSNPATTTQTTSNTSYTFTGLTDGTSYTFTATATNANGTSIASSASNSVTPVSSTYYLASFGTTGTEAVNAIRKDSSGNWYTAGVEGGSLISGVRKFNPSFTSITWQKIASLGQYTGYDGLELDSSGNPIVGGYNNQNGRVAGRAKFNATDGSTIWHYYYNAGGYGNGIAQDSAGNLYSASSYNGAPGMIKSNSSGTSPVIYYYNGGTYGTGVSYNPSNDLLYFLSTGQANVYRGEITCFNTSGSVQWSKYFTNTYCTGYSQNISFDSSNNIYNGTFACDSGTSGGYALAVKMNSSGVQQWSRKLDSGTGTVDQFQGSVVDSSGNIYFVGGTGSSGLIAKYNSSGTIQWQRTMTNCSFNDVMLDSSLELVIGGTIGSDGFVVRVPTDGTKTGSYTVNGVSLVYAASSLTESASGLSSGDTGYGFGSNSLSVTSVSTSYTNDSSTLTKVTI